MNSVIDEEDYDLSVYTDKLRYVEGDIITISGNVIDEHGCYVDNKRVVVTVKPQNSEKIVYGGSTYSMD